MRVRLLVVGRGKHLDEQNVGVDAVERLIILGRALH